jgi:integral membrane sensor domain MASE1
MLIGFLLLFFFFFLIIIMIEGQGRIAVKKSATVGRMSVCQLAMIIGLFIGIYSIKNFEDDGKRLACPRFRN